MQPANLVLLPGRTFLSNVPDYYAPVVRDNLIPASRGWVVDIPVQVGPSKTTLEEVVRWIRLRIQRTTRNQEIAAARLAAAMAELNRLFPSGSVQRVYFVGGLKTLEHHPDVLEKVRANAPLLVDIDNDVGWIELKPVTAFARPAKVPNLKALWLGSKGPHRPGLRLFGARKDLRGFNLEVHFNPNLEPDEVRVYNVPELVPGTKLVSLTGDKFLVSENLRDDGAPRAELRRPSRWFELISKLNATGGVVSAARPIDLWRAAKGLRTKPVMFFYRLGSFNPSVMLKSRRRELPALDVFSRLALKLTGLSTESQFEFGGFKATLNHERLVVEGEPKVVGNPVVRQLPLEQLGEKRKESFRPETYAGFDLSGTVLDGSVDHLVVGGKIIPLIKPTIIREVIPSHLLLANTVFAGRHDLLQLLLEEQAKYTLRLLLDGAKRSPTKDLCGFVQGVAVPHRGDPRTVYVPASVGAVPKTGLVFRYPVNGPNSIQWARIKPHLDGEVIKIHPRLMAALDGDFDGDMAFVVFPRGARANFSGELGARKGLKKKRAPGLTVLDAYHIRYRIQDKIVPLAGWISQRAIIQAQKAGTNPVPAMELNWALVSFSLAGKNNPKLLAKVEDILNTLQKGSVKQVQDVLGQLTKLTGIELPASELADLIVRSRQLPALPWIEDRSEYIGRPLSSYIKKPSDL
ncbi:MAG: hypothetical protein QXT45_07480 [Candidatus Bilamarchaeaceae archaeon]